MDQARAGGDSAAGLLEFKTGECANTGIARRQAAPGSTVMPPGNPEIQLVARLGGKTERPEPA